jgi:hypothetical protein
MPRAIGSIALALLLSGCSSALFSGEDVRIKATGDTIYILARSDGVSRNLCATLSGNVQMVEARWGAPSEGRLMRTGQVRGCYTVRHIIVCEDGDNGCLAHEERHKREGPFHH